MVVTWKCFLLITQSKLHGDYWNLLCEDYSEMLFIHDSKTFHAYFSIICDDFYSKTFAVH